MNAEQTARTIAMSGVPCKRIGLEVGDTFHATEITAGGQTVWPSAMLVVEHITRSVIILRNQVTQDTIKLIR